LYVKHDADRKSAFNKVPLSEKENLLIDNIKKIKNKKLPNTTSYSGGKKQKTKKIKLDRYSKNKKKYKNTKKH
jgi:hypothetical protein